MKSKILIMIFAVFILAGFGCQRGAPGFEPELVEYHKGYGGLEINIVKGLPPDEVIEKGEFVVGLELKNKGAYDIEGGKIIVYGFEDGYVSLDKFQVNVDIDGKKPGFPEGGFEIVNFNGINHAIPGSADIFLSPFTVRAYYRYQTEAGAEVCINPNIYSYVKTKEIVCEPGAVELSGGQGAPVAITRIEESVVPFGNRAKINFIIYFENKGDGEVIEGVWVDDVRLANVPISCVRTDRPIKLEKNEEKSISCQTETSVTVGSYLSSLSIRLIYDYTSKVDKTIKIKSLSAD